MFLRTMNFPTIINLIYFYSCSAINTDFQSKHHIAENSITSDETKTMILLSN